MNQIEPLNDSQDVVRTTAFLSPWQLGALLVFFVVAVYWPTLSNGFIWDDDLYVYQNAMLKSRSGLLAIWSRPGAVPQYYPLVHTTFWIEYHLWRLDPLGYHVVNMLLHAASAVLVWRLLLRLSLPGAWLAAAIFAVHPVGVESVAWVTERKNVLSCALALASLLAYLRFSPAEDPGSDKTATANSGRRSWYYELALALYVTALLAKTVAVSVPAVILVIYWWKRGRVRWADVAPLIPFFAVGLALASVTVWMEKTHVGASGEEWSLSLVQRLLIAGRALWFYAGKLAWPHPLVFFYPRWTVDAHVAWQYVFPAAALALLAGLWVTQKRIGRGPLAAVLIFAGVLTPALGFFDVYPFRFSFVADHFQYHAMIALVALAAAGIAMLEKRATKDAYWVGPTLATAVVLPLACLAQEQTSTYKDLVTFYECILEQNPDAIVAHQNLGIVLQRERKYKQAAAHYLAVLATHPKEPRALYKYGTLLAETGDIEQAIEMITESLEVDPNYSRAEHALGKAYLGIERTDPAVTHLENAVHMWPSNAEFHTDLAIGLIKAGNLTSAEKHLREAIKLNPRSADAHTYLGVVLAEHNDFDAAIDEYRAALKIAPQHQIARKSLSKTVDAKYQPKRLAP
jgi:tetratricopeptide (TPR) repeat protein